MKIIRSALILLGIICLSICLAGHSFADTVIMNDGKEAKGIVIEDYKDRIIFSTPDGEMTMMKADIRELVFDSDDDNLVKLAEQATDRRDYTKAMNYYERALKANPGSAGAKQGIIFLRGTILRKEESQKTANIKRQEEIESYGRNGTPRSENDEINDMAKALAVSTGMTISIKDSMPEIDSVKIDSPAFEAGLKKGDILVSVWDKLTGYLSFKETLDLLLNRSAIEIRCLIERTADITIDPKKTLLSGSEDLIGASLAMELEGLTISALKENGPAMAAGIQTGDLVMAIDGKQTRYMQLKKAIELIKNSKQGSIQLKIRRNAIIWRNSEL